MKKSNTYKFASGVLCVTAVCFVAPYNLVLGGIIAVVGIFLFFRSDN